MLYSRLIALDNLCSSVTRGKLQSVYLSSNRFTSFNLTYSNKSLQETQPDLNEIDLSKNFLNADFVKMIQDFKQFYKAIHQLEPLVKTKYKKMDENNVKTNYENESITKNMSVLASVEKSVQNEKQNTTWIAVTSPALAVAVFAVIGAILDVCKQRKRTNPSPNVNDAVMLNELYGDVRPTRADDDDKSSPLYDDVGVQPTYLAVLPDNPGPQPLEQEDIEPEENHYKEIG